MRNNSGVLWFLLLSVAALIVVRQWFQREEPLTPLPLPPLMAAGWVNTDSPPPAEELRGKLVVIDAWATWCGFCIKELPDLIDLHRQLGEEVVLIGLTPEGGSEAATVKDFVAGQAGMTWPIGYGSAPTLDALGVRGFPTFYLFDRDGMLIWQGHQVKPLEEQVIKALGM